jgi:hypothetical protein
MLYEIIELDANTVEKQLRYGTLVQEIWNHFLLFSYL